MDGDHRGQLVGARDDYARTDEEMRQVRDLLNWVVGDEHVSPLRSRFMVRPPLDHLAFEEEEEEEAADAVARQGRPEGVPVSPEAHPPQHGEAIQATIRWLRGEILTPPAGEHGCGPYG